MKTSLVAIAVLALVALRTGWSMGMPAKDPEPVIKEALPYIKCTVCERFAEAVVETLKTLRSNALHGKIGEIQVAEVLDAACNPKNETGEWIRRLDIVQTKTNGKTTLSLEKHDSASKCGAECVTIARSCSDMLENDLDADDLSAYLWKRMTYSTKEVQKKICKELSDRCSKSSIKPVPANVAIPDFPFVPMEAKDLEMERLMESMKEMGMGANMFSRDDMMNMNMGDMYGDESDYEDESGAGRGGYEDEEF